MRRRLNTFHHPITPMRITLKDIALRAHIDAGAVSRTLRNDPEAQRLRPETRERIIRIAREMGYTPNLVAASTRTGIVNTIGVIGSFEESHFVTSYGQMMGGLIKECVDNGFTVKFYSGTCLQKSLTEIEGSLIKKLICITPEHAIREQIAQFCLAKRLDVVFLYEHPHGNFPTFNVDNHAAIKNAVAYLVKQGHQRIGLLCVPHNRYHYIEERHQGFLDGMTEAGLAPDPRLMTCTDQTAAAVEAMLSRPASQRPTALIGIADDLAAIAQQVALHKGMKLPDDLATMGMGNSIVCPLLACPLTSIDDFLHEYGKYATRILLGKSCDLAQTDQGIYHIPSQIIERESTSGKVSIR